MTAVTTLNQGFVSFTIFNSVQLIHFFQREFSFKNVDKTLYPYPDRANEPLFDEGDHNDEADEPTDSIRGEVHAESDNWAAFGDQEVLSGQETFFEDDFGGFGDDFPPLEPVLDFERTVNRLSVISLSDESDFLDCESLNIVDEAGGKRDESICSSSSSDCSFHSFESTYFDRDEHLVEDNIPVTLKNSDESEGPEIEKDNSSNSGSRESVTEEQDNLNDNGSLSSEKSDNLYTTNSRTVDKNFHGPESVENLANEETEVEDKSFEIKYEDRSDFERNENKKDDSDNSVSSETSEDSNTAGLRVVDNTIDCPEGAVTPAKEETEDEIEGPEIKSDDRSETHGSDFEENNNQNNENFVSSEASEDSNTTGLRTIDRPEGVENPAKEETNAEVEGLHIKGEDRSESQESDFEENNNQNHDNSVSSETSEDSNTTGAVEGAATIFTIESARKMFKKWKADRASSQEVVYSIDIPREDPRIPADGSVRRSRYAGVLNQV